MSLMQLVWNFLKAKPINTALQVLLLALGVGVIVVLILLRKEIHQKVESTVRGIDLVVGAKGSPLQLILCNVLQADFPTGNIKLHEAERIASHPLIKKAIPLALGDSYANMRIVGTTEDYAKLYQADLATGQWYQQNFEVVVGSIAAQNLELTIGSQFESTHGLTNDGHTHDNLFAVVGILKPTYSVLDNLILTNIPSVWEMHDAHHHKHDEGQTVGNASKLVKEADAADTTLAITSLLIQYRSPLGAVQLPRAINETSNLQSASPAFEIARLFTLLSFGEDILRSFSIVIVVISGLSIFIGLYHSLNERQYDLAMMRVMGASRLKLLGCVLLEGCAITVGALLLGAILGHCAVYLITIVLPSQQLQPSPWAFYIEEIWVLLSGMVVGLISSLLPAFKAYRLNIHQTLSHA
jgi:putative ABC transport system permease protein